MPSIVTVHQETALPCRGAAKTIFMVSPTIYERAAWEDRFNRPTIEALRAALSPDATKIFNQLRRHLLAVDGVTEGFNWQGVCWRWTIEYYTEHSEEPLALLVPSPTDLQLAVPLDREFVRSLSMRRMKRSVREGIGLAQDPFDTRWGVWSIQTEGLIEDLVDLIERKLRDQARRAG